jgi:hypothetical protein
LAEPLSWSRASFSPLWIVWLLVTLDLAHWLAVGFHSRIQYHFHVSFILCSHNVFALLSQTFLFGVFGRFRRQLHVVAAPCSFEESGIDAK